MMLFTAAWMSGGKRELMEEKSGVGFRYETSGGAVRREKDTVSQQCDLKVNQGNTGKETLQAVPPATIVGDTGLETRKGWVLLAAQTRESRQAT